MLERYKALIAEMRSLKEVDALSERDLEDIGMSRDRVKHFIRMPADAPDRMRAMAKVFGIDAQLLHDDHAAYLDRLDCCGSCKSRAACTKVLEKGEAAQPAEADFCPNAEDFTSLAASAR